MCLCRSTRLSALQDGPYTRMGSASLKWPKLRENARIEREKKRLTGGADLKKRKEEKKRAATSGSEKMDTKSQFHPSTVQHDGRWGRSLGMQKLGPPARSLIMTSCFGDLQVKRQGSECTRMGLDRATVHGSRTPHGKARPSDSADPTRHHPLVNPPCTHAT